MIFEKIVLIWQRIKFTFIKNVITSFTQKKLDISYLMKITNRAAQ